MDIVHLSSKEPLPCLLYWPGAQGGYAPWFQLGLAIESLSGRLELGKNELGGFESPGSSHVFKDACVVTTGHCSFSNQPLCITLCPGSYNLSFSSSFCSKCLFHTSSFLMPLCCAHAFEIIPCAHLSWFIQVEYAICWNPDTD